MNEIQKWLSLDDATLQDWKVWIWLEIFSIPTVWYFSTLYFVRYQ